MSTERPAVPLLRQDRLEQRLEHFMSEITATENRAPAPHPVNPRQWSRLWRWPVVAGGGAVAAGTAGVFVASSVLGGASGQGPAAFAFQIVSNDTISIRVVNSDVAAKE